jgi:hypothetical protein
MPRRLAFHAPQSSFFAYLPGKNSNRGKLQRSLFGRSTAGFRGLLAFFLPESWYRNQIWRSFRLDFNQEDQDREQDQQVVEQGQRWNPF